MEAKELFWFWLGSLDSRVMAGGPDTGGTRDVRFGFGIEKELKRFVFPKRFRNSECSITLEPFLHYAKYELRLDIEKEGRTRAGECSLPAQHKYSRNPYPLWADVVDWINTDEDALQFVLLIKDITDKYHARVLRYSGIRGFPIDVRRLMRDRSERGKRFVFNEGEYLRFSDNYKPLTNNKEPAFEVSEEPPSDPDELKDKIKATNDEIKAVTGTSRKISASRKLVKYLKELYKYQCQLCNPNRPDSPVIEKLDGTQYVEVHHIEGKAELLNNSVYRSDDQELNDILIDDSKNLIVLCPYHHKLLHYYKSPVSFYKRAKVFRASDGSIRLRININHHL